MVENLKGAWDVCLKNYPMLILARQGTSKGLGCSDVNQQPRKTNQGLRLIKKPRSLPNVNFLLVVKPQEIISFLRVSLKCK